MQCMSLLIKQISNKVLPDNAGSGTERRPELYPPAHTGSIHS